MAGTTNISSATVLNAAGGGSTSVKRLVEIAGDTLGRPVDVDWHPAEPGDVFATGGAIDRARESLGWEPQVSIVEGVGRQAAWHRARRA